MAISEVSGPGVTAVGTSIAPSITHGMTILANDIVVAVLNHNSSLGLASDSGNGLTEHYELIDGGGASGVWAIYSKRSDGNEPAAYTFTAGVGAQYALGVRVFRGCEPSGSYWDVTPGSSTTSEDSGASTTATSTDLTISTAGALAVMFGMTDNTSYPFSWGSPTNSYGSELQTSGTYPLYSTTRECPSTGAIGSMQCTLSGSQDWCIVLGALKPASETPATADRSFLLARGIGIA